MLCADLVDIQWKDKAGKMKKGVANLEDISLSGACLQVDFAVPLNSTLKISYPKGRFEGKVKYCVFRQTGYFVGIEFEPESRWSIRKFKPQHFLDPRRLVVRAVKSAVAEAKALNGDRSLQ